MLPNLLLSCAVLQWAASGDDAALADKVSHYHTLYPLEDMSNTDEHVSSTLGVRSTVLKAISALDGQAYVLRQIDGRQVGATCVSAATAVLCCMWRGCCGEIQTLSWN